MSEPSRAASRSAMLVAACRLLAAELPEHERLIDDPFAHLVCDEPAIAAARADEPLQQVIRLRTRYIDDAVIAFCAGEPVTQVLLLGAGYDARPYRLTLAANCYEVDFPATLALRAEAYGALTAQTPRVSVPVDLANESFDAPLLAAGFDAAAPTIVVWEGVVNYLSASVAEGVVRDLGAFLAPRSRLIADYVEMNWFRGGDLERTTKAIAQRLGDGGEPLRAGLPDAHGTLRRAGFEVLDDEAVELLPARYGTALQPRHYPARILTAVRTAD